MDILAHISVVGTFCFAGVASVSPEIMPDWLQYGAFGLCCVMVFYLLWYIKDMGKVIREKDKDYIALIREDIESRNKLSQALSDRPCLGNDKRVKN